MKKGNYEPEEFIHECVKRYNDTDMGVPFTYRDKKYAIYKIRKLRFQRNLFLAFSVLCVLGVILIYITYSGKQLKR